MATARTAPADGPVSWDRTGALARAVQTNCHIADSRHAADLPLCIYLLQMREFYRWEQGLPFSAPLDRQDVGRWLAAREQLWHELEGRDFVALPIGTRSFDALDTDAINAALAPEGLCYGVGMAGNGQHDFFLGQLHVRGCCDDGVPLEICAQETARGLLAPAAALVGGLRVVVRRESLARLLWEKFETHSLYRSNRPFEALLQTYGVDDGAAFVSALSHIVDDQTETLVLHEQGEYRAGLWLDPAWAQLRLGGASRRAQLHLRAVRDQLADLEVTLPALLERGADRALHFWFAHYDGVRAQLFPSLLAAYDRWRGGDHGIALGRAIRCGAAHFRSLAARVLALHERCGPDAGPRIEHLLVSPESACRPDERSRVSQ
jgi:Family of unknown function (DUF6866) N-terminal domain/Family of unknown function (DUF6866) C-terminal domain